MLSADEDDFDPLAPQHYTSELDESVIEDASSGGSCDARKVVRVWVEEGRLTKVRVSPTWATKLQGHSLSGAFGQAFMLSNVTVGVVDAAEPEPSLELPPELVPTLTPRSFAAMRSAFDSVEARWNQALDSAPATPSHSVTTGRSEGVTVTLNEAGQVSAADFTDDWLDDAHAGDICVHVMKAAEAACARYSPPPPAHPLTDQLRAEHQLLQAALRTMLNPKG